MFVVAALKLKKLGKLGRVDKLARGYTTDESTTDDDMTPRSNEHRMEQQMLSDVQPSRPQRRRRRDKDSTIGRIEPASFATPSVRVCRASCAFRRFILAESL